jgi:DDB1- and CUL4-associated factor 12
MLRQREFKAPEVDKIFACKWLDNDRIVCGTKDNKLLELNVNSGNIREIPRPREPPRNFSTQNTAWGSCGIHCLDINPSGDLLATGGAEPADCVVLRTSDYSPVTTLVGHRDWLFGSAWVSDRHLVTGSRDKAMALWTINPDENIGMDPTIQEYQWQGPQMKRKYDGKVRELKYDFNLRMVVGLGTDGVVKLHDPTVDLRVMRTVREGGREREIESLEL